MAIDFQDWLATLPEARRRAIEARADKLIAEERGLAELRKDLEQSQVELAEKMGVRQADISKIERRGDMLISTLRRYVEAVGGSLEIIVSIPGRPRRRLTFGERRAGRLELPAGVEVVRVEAKPKGISSSRRAPSKAAAKGPASGRERK
jgi:transcriptional regulator with XRE-family HTH domain